MQRFIAFVHRLLERGGRMFRTDLTYLARGSFWLSIGQAVTSASSLALTIAFANIFSKDAYGIYKYVLSLAGLLSVFSLSGFGDGILRSSARGHDSTIFPATRERIKFATLGALVGLCVAGYYFLRHNPTLGTALLFAALSLPFFDTFSLFAQYLQGKEDFKKSTWYTTAVQLFSTIAIAVVLISTKGSVIWVLGAYFVGYALFRYLYYRKVTKNIDRTTPSDHASIIYGRHVSILGVIGMIASRLDSILIFSHVGAADLATYSIGVSAPSQVKGPMGNLETMVMTRYSKRDVASIASDMHRKMLIMLGVNVIIVICYIVAAPFVFALVFPQYVGAVAYSQVFALSLLGGAFLPVDTFITAHQRIREQYMINVFYSVTRIIGMVAGLYLYGIMGLVVARVITGFLTNFLQYYLYRRIVKKDAEGTAA